MSRINYLRAIVLWFFLTSCFSYGEAFQGSDVNFTVPENYNPTETLSSSQYKEGELLVRFAPKDGGVQTTIEERNAILEGLGGGEIECTYNLVPGSSLIKLPEGVTVEEVLGNFNKAAGILYAQPNYILKAFSIFPNDPCGPVTNGGDQWGLHNTGQTGGTLDADIDAPDAWYIATDSNIIVAVIDTGVDYTHPDLAANMWTDSNGHHGYDFHNNDSDPMDDNLHGTHVAGIIGAVGNNAKGITGVCWNVKIMALKFQDEFGNGSTADAISCIDYAVSKGAKVLSNSWGSYDYNPQLLNHIEAANASGVLFIASAGNDGYSYPGYPARFDCNNIISVMASDANDARSIWPSGGSSNWGPNSVDLAAPGSAILSCLPYGQYYYMNGTSASVPFVAGACALVWARNPSLSHLQVKNIILNSVDQKPALNGLCVTGGRLNLFNALAIANASGLFLNKVDDINDANGVLPGNDINYTISYRNPPVGDPNYIGDVNNAVITDYLPGDLAFISASGPNIAYHPSSHTVTWNLGTLEPNEQGSVTLTVKINDCISECGAIINTCKISGGNWTRWANEDTPVLCASSPSPTCGGLSDFLCSGEPNLNLTWCTGRFAAHNSGHEVYFGTNYDDVRDADNSWPPGEVYKGTFTNPTYPIEADKLELGTTYYWRIDEVNPEHPNVTRWKGSVWSFTTDCNIIDNFNSYVTTDAIEHIWKDWYYQTGYNPVTRAQVTVTANTNLPYRGGPPYRSMQYEFLNKTSPYYSEVNATIGTGTYDLKIDPNWSAMSAKILSLWFYGQATGNDANKPMYVTLGDSDTPVHIAKVNYNGDMNDIREPEWHQWTIPLEDFTGVNMSKVKTIVVGFGIKNQPSTDGKVWFENIGLYLNKRCFPGCWPVSDFDSDCTVDFYDFAILAQSWLTDPNQPNYNPVCNISALDGNGINVYDLARFCEDWLWYEVGRMPTGAGYSELLCSPPSGGERVESTGGELAEGVELQSAPQPQVQPESATEPLQSEPQYEPVHTTQELIDWLQGLLEDEQIKNTPTEDNIRKIIESLKEELQNQSVTVTP